MLYSPLKLKSNTTYIYSKSPAVSKSARQGCGFLQQLRLLFFSRFPSKIPGIIDQKSSLLYWLLFLFFSCILLLVRDSTLLETFVNSILVDTI